MRAQAVFKFLGMRQPSGDAEWHKVLSMPTANKGSDRRAAWPQLLPEKLRFVARTRTPWLLRAHRHEQRACPVLRCGRTLAVLNHAAKEDVLPCAIRPAASQSSLQRACRFR
jgi:hypothetical protein